MIDIALALIVHPDKQRILVARRPEGVHLAGYWEFPGGKVELGETSEDAAVREAGEEVGLIVSILRPMLPVVHTYPERSVRLLPFLCLANSDAAVSASGEALRWVNCDELAELPLPDANRAIVEALQREIEVLD